MEYTRLSESVKIKTISETATEGVFEIDGLYSGYGLTVGNALRRVLLSSLPGACVTQIKIKNVKHEFTTIDGVMEDIVEIALNMKKVRFAFHADEPQVLTLDVKGEKVVTAGDIKANAQVEVINPESHIATLTEKKTEFSMEITVEKGLGYVPVEVRKVEKLPVGVIAIDAIFTPVTNVNFVVENMRVGERTDFNKIKLTIETDGSTKPSLALHKASNILKDHFSKVAEIADVTVETEDEEGEEEPKKKGKK
ncbi:MAG: DNA-directed RNA polymerase subunit alpha [Candidatus Wolfebacteria bacterium GW2011_GWC2_46_275]|uniref:DNA-directed RNA polymerase subunit alpha n=2 Tax=Candidatus Wolfeibacteriota TaxID=1752735 RepID=A0A0G1U4I0_9BACT|nr:MAG: DNA-directed RNA polymerase subunit alpha [Candidatus Wolfebacteria bacterium GW2011_GWB1_47_1]KKU36568.1 MAG: DNA-directed RNA polymerase subunit alpha [Candidatus Wolfebacteria bacterium GW2011_GWC2_46_275]KKU41702.1 MAG: DNA-directed RNA polymerase subunit alpha [Candidatus Wolfebacteria bacterium GW2011_GWB2_46_69]KKU54004.1 MAG: DNA-directed RNA polymerase subunit alpha [Candidatus Wolfebacteria bacterium GW2011_GWC1_47_103]KKU58994.1 MAG: DNA-directed RNA polymerase subunit alpha 